ncbi:RNA polymerase sigma-70 factor [Chitinophaga agrisoli]|nr:RNA polymerase sigma-70 factor [Chitinophaga agrisoli]
MSANPHPYRLFNQLFEATKDKLYAFVLKHTRDKHETEDILQHCYMKLWEHLEQVDIARIDNLLFTYARNVIIDQVRKKKASIIVLEPTLADTDLRADNTSPEKQLDLKELKAQVGSVIDKLPPKRKQVFILIRMQGMSYDEVSRQLGISKLTIKQHMHKALQFLWKETGHHYVPCLIALFLAARLI